MSSETLYTSPLKLEKLGSLHRRAHLPLGATAEMGVHHRLSIPAGTREVVDRALARHQDRCPTANSLKGAVQVSWTADVRED